jgi:hypothetical protein
MKEGANVSNEPWACPNCTFKNTAGHLACEMCGTQRNLEAKVEENKFESNDYQ